MKRLATISIFLGLILALNQVGFSQSADTTAGLGTKGYGLPFPVRGTCKGYRTEYYSTFTNATFDHKRSKRRGLSEKHSLLQVHGNILYDLNYRSNIDTPYFDREVYQHMAQSYLDITYKDDYPFRIFLTTRFSNSSWFRSFTDLNLKYNAGEFNNKVRRQVRDLLDGYPGLDSLRKLEYRLQKKEKMAFDLRHWLDSSGLLQKKIAAGEDKWLRSNTTASYNLPDIGEWENKVQGDPSSISGERIPIPKFNRQKGKVDNSDHSQLDKAEQLDHLYDSLQRRLDSLHQEIAQLTERYQAAKSLFDKRNSIRRDEFDKVTSGRELKEKLDDLQIPDSSLPKGYQTLYSIRTLSLGRALLDYSELSAKNISINGLQVEYNPKAYMAFAAGTVDYRFRDYTIQTPGKTQYIGLVRYGWGQKEGNNVILTYYTGRRQLYNIATTAQGNDIPNYNLMGFTVEGKYRINKTTFLTAEVAKSSVPYYSLDSAQRHNLFSSTTKMNDRTNEAYSLKLSSFFPVSQTQVTAAYRHFGQNFQSFSLFTTGSAQKSWAVKVDQPFFNKRLMVTASIKTNDFTNPYISGYQSTSIFKSIQATLRTKHWPTVSAGYFPSSQVIKLGDGQFQENLFYTLMGNINHVYKMNDMTMMSMLMYTRFYNKVADSNFVYFNSTNLSFTQNIFFGKLNWQSLLSAATNTSYSLYVLENKASYRLKSWLELGAGLKYNKQTVYNVDQLGYSGEAMIRVPKLGEFRFSWDKGFIPGASRQLVENKVGRLTYFKEF